MFTKNSVNLNRLKNSRLIILREQEIQINILITNLCLLVLRLIDINLQNNIRIIGECRHMMQVQFKKKLISIIPLQIIIFVLFPL